MKYCQIRVTQITDCTLCRNRARRLVEPCSLAACRDNIVAQQLGQVADEGFLVNTSALSEQTCSDELVKF